MKNQQNNKQTNQKKAKKETKVQPYPLQKQTKTEKRSQEELGMIQVCGVATIFNLS